MKYIILGIYIFLVLFLIGSIRSSKRTSNNKDETVISLSKILLYIGSVGFGLFFVISAVLFFTSYATASLCFLLFSLMGYALLLAYFNCKITYNETEFTHSTFIGITRTFSYDEITGIHGKNKDVKILIGKRSIRVDETTVGKEKFISFVKKQYRKSHNGDSIPLAKPKSDIFRGNIENPAEFIVVYSLVLGLIIFCIILCITIGISDSSKEVLNSKVSFVRYEEDDNILKLYTNDDKEYRIGNYKDVVTDLGGLLEFCNGKEKLDVTYTLHDDNAKPVHRLKSITAENGAVLLSADAVEALNKSSARITCIAFGIVIALMLGFFGTSIYVGRNADKLKPWIVKLFFKSSYVKWK